ncbi:MAG: sugar ABC transporter substrate-binding protein [SAR324 cluster bacterium]|nr:sugar ABC transporter substrate-binding protein [SAR324 cluster bacterium]
MLYKILFSITLSLIFVIHSIGAQTLKYMMWDPSQLEVEKETIAAFENSNPGLKIEVNAMPPKEYWPRISALAAAGDLPDVFAMSSGYIQSWQADGQLYDLKSFANQLDMSKWFSGAMDVARLGGGLYAFPQNWVAPVMYFNKDAFDEAGIPYPTSNWTWNDFLSAAILLTKDKDNDGKIDQYGYWAYGRYAHIEPWIFRNGGSLLNEDRTRLSPDFRAIEAMRFVTDMVNLHQVAPKPQDMEGIRQQDVFPMGMAAMWVDGSWNIANVRKITKDKFRWGISQVPKGPNATTSSAKGYAWADMLAVSPNTEHADLAWKFIMYMTGPGRTAKDFLGGKVPAHRPIAESNEWLERDLQPANKEIILEIGLSQTTTSFTPKWSKWRGYAASRSGGMNGELDEVFNGRQSLREAIDNFVEYGNQVLSK